MAYFKCGKNIKPKIDYLYDWDFTESLTDKIANKNAEMRGKASRDSEGVKILANVGVGALRLFDSTSRINLTGKTLEIEFSANLKNSTSFIYFIATDSSNFMWDNNNNIWKVIKGSTEYPYTLSFSKVNFENATLRFVHDSDLLRVYELNKTTKEFDLVYSGSPYALYPYVLSLSFSGTGCYEDLIIKAVRIFENL